MNINSYMNDGHLKIIVKPNSPKTEIISWDENNLALKVNVHARPEDNKANIELIKYFSKLLKRKVSIKSGLRSKEKILKLG